MIVSLFFNKIIGIYVGKLWSHPGWEASLVLAPRRDLTEEGRWMRCGLALVLRWEWSRLSFQAYSDADWIADRILEGASA